MVYHEPSTKTTVWINWRTNSNDLDTFLKEKKSYFENYPKKATEQLSILNFISLKSNFLIETEKHIFLFFLYEGTKKQQEKLEDVKIVFATYAQLKKDYPQEFRIKENL